ncbi:MAG: adenylate/guanylate cyclase domain-containing protein [Myxococcota bacterium]|nr:adenylate/guanylate cyclase domain-containing protein [Myxococcota bacterium]
MLQTSRILVVDDDHSILRLLELALSQAGCEVVSASSGTDGLSEVVKGDFAAVVTDISMPGMTGIELIEAIASLKPELPVLVLSAHAEYELVMEAIQKGAFDYITKDKEISSRVVHGVAKAQRHGTMLVENNQLNEQIAKRNSELEALDLQNRRLIERFMKLNEQLEGEVDVQASELISRVAELTAINEIAGAISSVAELNEVLRMTMQKSRKVMSAEASSLMLLAEDGSKLRFFVTTGDYGSKLDEGEVPLGHGLAGWVAEHREPLLVEDAYDDPRFDRGYDNQTGFKTGSVLCVPLEIQGKLLGVAQVLNPTDKKTFEPSDMRTFSIFAHHAAIAIHRATLLDKANQAAEEHRQALERERWLTTQRDKLELFVPKSAREQIATEREDVLASPTQTIWATVLFSDIKGFTSIVEKTSPTELVEGLNRYHSEMYDVLEKHGGVLDKFMGDGIMAVFIPRGDRDNSALRCVRCGIDMQERIEKLAPEWREQGLGELSVRIGIQSGEVISGSIGASTRRDYTVLGDSVNVAARLESHAPVGGVLLGGDTYAQVVAYIEAEELEPIAVKNRQEPVASYLVTGEKDVLPD